ncbi:MAG: glycosyltransferase [Candidatus Hodarchaeota archaeon]
MKICYIAAYPPEKAGITQYSQKLVDSISKLQKHLIYVISGKIKEEKKAENSKIDVRRIWKRRSIFYPFTIFKEIIKIKPDIVHAQFGPYGLEGGGFIGEYFLILLFLLKLFHIKTTITIHSFYTRKQVEIRAAKRLNNKFFKKIISTIFIGFTKLVEILTDTIQFSTVRFHSKFKEKILQEYKMKPNKTLEIPHPCESNKNLISKSTARKKLDITQKLVLLCFGYIYPIKGIEYAIKALDFLKNRKDIILIIAGQTHPTEGLEYTSYLNDLIKKGKLRNKDINIRFINRFMSEEEVILLFSAADLILLPYTESYGTSGPYHQAIGFGKPAIAFKIGLHWIDVTDKKIILCPFKDIRCLAKKIDFFYENPEELKKVSKKLLDHAEKETWEKFGERTIEYYKKIITKKK